MVCLKIDNAGCPHGCNSLGLILIRGQWVPCPIHGKKSDILLENGKLPNGESLYDLLNIPVEYRGHWVTDISRLFMNEDITNNFSNIKISKSKVYENIESGENENFEDEDTMNEPHFDFMDRFKRK